MSASAPNLTIRSARESDVPQLLDFILELAEYERLSDAVDADEARLRETLFGVRPTAEALLAELDAEAVGFALYFHNYSTFLGRKGLYLEDLYVRSAARGHGVGAALLRRLAAIALERGCGRFEWAVLDWNEPAIGFYKKLGATAMNDWTIYRLEGASLQRLAGAQPDSPSASQ